MEDLTNEKSQSGEIAEGLLEKTPLPSEQIVEKEREKIAALTDGAGIVFDPAKHAVDKEGKPIKTISGTFALKRGRKGASNQATDIDSTKRSPRQGKSELPPSEPAVNPYLIAGRAATGMIFQAGMLIGGEEWMPLEIPEQGISETANMEKAFSDYFKVKGITDFPPGIALSITLIAYALPRLTKPQTRNRFKMAILWVKSKIGRKIGGNYVEKKSEETHS